MNQERLLTIIRKPVISEKATLLSEKQKQFVFKVSKTAHKHEIKLAVEHLFHVKVSDVAVLNVKGKQKRFKQKLGVRSDWKKAYVTLQSGFDIDFAVEQ